MPRETFFSDKRCLRGHIGLRYVKGHACVECVKLTRKRARDAETPEQRQVRLVRMRIAGKEWYEKNKEERKRKGRERYAREKDHFITKAANYYVRAREQILLQSKEYYRKNKDKVSLRQRISGAQRRALGEVEKSYVDFLHNAQKGRCSGCERKLVKFHLDHKIAIANGGTNERRNLQLLCPNCNLRKATKSMEEFMRRMGKLL